MSQNPNGLREQVMINQFVLAAGCSVDQAISFLQSSQWQYETALSLFFGDAPVDPPPFRNQMNGCQKSSNGGQMLSVPANSPETPPDFPQALLAFSKLSADGRTTVSGSSAFGPVPRNLFGSSDVVDGDNGNKGVEISKESHDAEVGNTSTSTNAGQKVFSSF